MLSPSLNSDNLNTLNFSSAELGYLYNLGVKNFKTKSYSRALAVFQLLMFFDNKNLLYVKAAAGAFHMLKNYANAILAYRHCYNLDSSLSNKDCKFYTGVCLFELLDFKSAEVEFNSFLENPEKNQARLNKQAELYLLAIKKHHK